MLKQVISAIEALEDQKKDIGEEIKDQYTFAKSEGYDPKILRKIVARRALTEQQRNEYDTLVELYEAELANS